MRKELFFPITFIALLLPGSVKTVSGQQRTSAVTGEKRKPTDAREQTAKPAMIPPTQKGMPLPTIRELITQGKAFYKAAKYKQALGKFEEVLKQEPSHDEALGLAAVTAFRLDSQSQSRDYFLRRAALPSQKDSVKSYSYYRAALSHWRQVHDIVAKFCQPQDSRYISIIPDRYELDVKYGIENGLDLADRALSITKNFSEAYNIKNLLYSEAALIAADEKKAKENRQKATMALRRAMELFKMKDFGATKETADFGAPTIRIAEYPLGKNDEPEAEDWIRSMVEGGKPVKRVNPEFPSIRSSKDTKSGDSSASGVTPDGGAYSLGSGRGALTAAYAPGKVIVEVLVSSGGNVVFTRVIDGRSDLRGAAILAARSWKFEPAKVDGKPVQVSGVITFNMRPGPTRQ